MSTADGSRSVLPGPLEAAALATLLAFLLAPIGSWAVRPATVTLAGLALVAPTLRNAASTWAALAFLAALRVALDWPMSDNHAYLLALWCASIAWAVRGPRPAFELASNARWLIAAVFVMATLQKCLSPDYLDGTFFRVLFLTDARFEDLAIVLGIDFDRLDAARSLLEAPPPPIPGAEALAGSGVERTEAFDRAASFATAWTLAIEAAVAAAFLLPTRIVGRVRDATLLAFVITTYALATVEGFGWLLLAMGFAQCPADRLRTRRAYLVAYVLLLVYREVPWMGWLADAALAGPVP